MAWRRAVIMNSSGGPAANKIDKVLTNPWVDRMVGVLAVVPFVYVIWELLRARPIRLENLFFLMREDGKVRAAGKSCKE
jgi:hypothetical protein